MASASDMSFAIALGTTEFMFAGPTQTLVFPVCSNSLTPSCVRSAPETSDRTTLLGNLSSRCCSMPRALVVLTMMQVC